MNKNMANRTFEFWAIDKNGHKWNEYVTTKSSRKTKIKTLITKKYKIDIEQCKDFGIREVSE